MKYIKNNIKKPYKVRVLHYTDHIRDMHGMDSCLSRYIKKVQEYHVADWGTRNKPFNEEKNIIATRDGLLPLTRYDTEDRKKYYCSIQHE